MSGNAAQQSHGSAPLTGADGTDSYGQVDQDRSVMQLITITAPVQCPIEALESNIYWPGSA